MAGRGGGFAGDDVIVNAAIVKTEVFSSTVFLFYKFLPSGGRYELEKVFECVYRN